MIFARYRMIYNSTRKHRYGILLYFSLFSLLFVGDSVLHATLAVERVGRRKDSRSYDGPRHRSLFGSWKETEKKNAPGLSVGKSQISQLVGLQILHLRAACADECYRWVSQLVCPFMDSWRIFLGFFEKNVITLMGHRDSVTRWMNHSLKYLA